MTKYQGGALLGVVMAAVVGLQTSRGRPYVNDPRQRRIALQMIQDGLQKGKVPNDYPEQVAAREKISLEQALVRVILAKDALNRYVH
jgi:hypothetical protein